MGLKDAVYGFAVGDALGVPYEFSKRGTFECTGMVGYGTHKQPAGTWSDDTSEMIATCFSIRRHGKIKIQSIANALAAWYQFGKYACNGIVFDVGCTTAYALNNYAMTCNPYTCGLDDEQSNGNGGLMRILPLAFVDNCTFTTVDEVCSITHAHKTSVDACLIYVSALIAISDGMTINDVFLNTYATFPHFERLAYLTDLEEFEIKSSGYVVHSLEAALWCFLTTDNYRDCVLKAVNLGDDTDTIAALAGGLAGLKYGINSIPGEWLEVLRNKELIERCLF